MGVVAVAARRLEDVADGERPHVVLEERPQPLVERVAVEAVERRLERQDDHALALGHLVGDDGERVAGGRAHLGERDGAEARLARQQLRVLRHHARRPPLLAAAQRHRAAGLDLERRKRLGVELEERRVGGLALDDGHLPLDRRRRVRVGLGAERAAAAVRLLLRLAAPQQRQLPPPPDEPRVGGARRYSARGAAAAAEVARRGGRQ